MIDTKGIGEETGMGSLPRFGNIAAQKMPQTLECAPGAVREETAEWDYSSVGNRYRAAPMAVPQFPDEFAYWAANHIDGRVATVRSGAVAV